MMFVVDDLVRYKPTTPTAGLPLWRNTVWRITGLSGPLPGQGDRMFARLERDDGEIQQGISTAMLVPAGEGPLDRNKPVAVPCWCCDQHAQLLPPLGDRSDYRCPTCGVFSVDGTTELLFELGTTDPKTARFAMLNGKRWLKPTDKSGPHVETGAEGFGPPRPAA